MSNRLVIKTLNSEFTNLYDDLKRLIEFAFPKRDKPFPQPDSAPHLYACADMAWSIHHLIHATNNMLVKESGSMVLIGGINALPPTAAALLEKLDAIHAKRLSTFQAIDDTALVKTIKDSEGEDTSVGEQMIILLCSGAKLLGQIYTHLEMKFGDVPPLF